MSSSSKIPGYERSLYRDHTGNYAEAEDMEKGLENGGPLFANQSQVPTLPVPSLDESCELFLRSCRPHVTAEEFERTVAAVEELRAEKGLGRELQRRLEARAEEKASGKKKGKGKGKGEGGGEGRTSWLTEWWNQGAYLGYKDSVVWNVSYYLQFKDECASSQANPCRRMARFVYHAVGFRESIFTGKLSPDQEKNGKVWSNTQYKYLFNATRMPGGGPDGADIVRTYAPDVHGHISVIRKGRFYSVQVVDDSGKAPLPVEAIEYQLKRVKQSADAKGWENYPIGVMTAENRDVWEQKRAALIAVDKANEASLERIQSSMFTVCLDDTSPVTRVDTGRELLHSDGNNRFFDKSFQVIIFENGKMGYNGEHSMMDGTTTTRFVNDILALMHAEPEAHYDVAKKDKKAIPETKPPYAPNGTSALPPPEELTFNLEPNTRKNIREAQEWHNSVMATKEFSVLMFHNFGKDVIKKFRLSPDAFMQVAIQLAYRLTFGHCRGTYESTATRRFLHSRTEVTRSVSLESEAFCEAVTSAAPASEMYDKLVAAVKQHASYTSKASQGRGCDRHLMGLKMSLKPGEKTPSLFTDPGFTRSSYWAISTSGLVGELMDGWGFGEVAPDGIGCGYSLGNRFIRCSVSSRHPQEKWAHRMTTNLETSLLLMRDICEKHVGGSKL